MTAADRLLALAEALPEGATVSLDAAALRRLAGIEEAERDAAAAPLDDLDAEAAGRAIGRSASTVRDWCAHSRIAGCYRLGRSWRIPRAALRAFLDAQAPRDRDERRDPRPVDLGRWRRSFRGAR